MKRWLQLYDRWNDNLLEKATARGRKLAWSFPSRNHPQLVNITYLSLTRYALAFSLLFVFTYSLIVVIGTIIVTCYVVTRNHHDSLRVQEKFIFLLLKCVSRHMYLQGFVWQQVIVALVLFAFASLLNEGKLRAWNRRAERLRLNFDVSTPQPSTPPGVWPPPSTSR